MVESRIYLNFFYRRYTIWKQEKCADYGMISWRVISENKIQNGCIRMFMLEISPFLDINLNGSPACFRVCCMVNHCSTVNILPWIFPLYCNLGLHYVIFPLQQSMTWKYLPTLAVPALEMSWPLIALLQEQLRGIHYGKERHLIAQLILSFYVIADLDLLRVPTMSATKAALLVEVLLLRAIVTHLNSVSQSVIVSTTKL